MTDFLDDERRRLAYADRAGTREQETPQHAAACIRPAPSDSTGDGWQCIPTCAVRIHKAAFLANHRRWHAAEHERLMAEVRADRPAVEAADREVDAAFKRIDDAEAEARRQWPAKFKARVAVMGQLLAASEEDNMPTPCALADGTGRHSRKEMEEATDDQQVRLKLQSAHRTLAEHHDLSCPLSISMAIADIDWCIKQLMPPPSPSVIAGVSFTSVPQLCAAYEYALETLKRLYLNVDPKQHAWQSEQDVMRDARALLLAAGKDVA